MARLESIASGGYFPTPQPLVPIIAKHLSVDDEILIIDPCAGKGEAVLGLEQALKEVYDTNCRLHLCEMEQARFDELSRQVNAVSKNYSNKVLKGDAFQVEFEKETASLLYLNPPYDHDPDYGRTEEKFLARFASSLVYRGVLIFVVPFYALKASAETLATEFERLECYRFPAQDFEAFSQVVLFAYKTETLPMPSSQVESQVLAWAADASTIPVLGEATPEPYHVAGWSRNWDSWKMREIDFQGLIRKAKPWFGCQKPGVYTPAPHVLPQIPVEDLMFREFPIATAPRPAHIAAGIASGLFNGRRVTSKRKGLPDLLVKGVFDREYVTIEEKKNRDGETTAVVQVQQPKLVTTILDLESKRYHTIKPAGNIKRTTRVEDMAMEDLLDHYGPSLMDVMARQCPVKYDPKKDYDRVPLAAINRKLYQAQDHAARALVQLLGGVDAKPRERRKKAAILLGEIGSGKTSVALTVGKTIGKRMLVLCPPHLLDSWKDETASVLPDAEFRVLQDVKDVDNLKDIPQGKFLVAVMSREAAKLGHSLDSVEGACPKCGATLPLGDLAKKRLRCESQKLTLLDTYAKAAFKLALQIAPYAPHNSRVEYLLSTRALQKTLQRYQKKAKAWKGFQGYLIPALLKLITEQVQKETSHDVLLRLFGKLLFANYNPEKIAELVTLFSQLSAASTYDYYFNGIARALWHMLPVDSELKASLKGQLPSHGYGYSAHFQRNEEEEFRLHGSHSRLGHIKVTDKGLTLDDLEVGSLKLGEKMLSHLTSLGKFGTSEACGEHLYQAVPKPRRVALSKYLKRHPKAFDFLVLDEGHEYATDGSAQERSAHRLTATGMPTILMTGSIMNGYAESLFANMWSLSRDFRSEFERHEHALFVDRYGYRKRILSDKDKESGEIVEFGAHTDRVERSERKAGDAPGILPLFLFRHLLPFSVTLHKADLALDLPPCRQIQHKIKPSKELESSYKALQTKLAARIKSDQFRQGYAGKLFGALAELPSYLDRATLDTGNQDDGTYQIRYPESIGGDLVAKGESFAEDELSAKEEWMLETVRAELAEGRRVMVFTWHVTLLPRLARLIEAEIGEKVPILYADKVPPKKRQEWINKQVIKPNRRVMVANPVAIQTGLNNLVHFCSQIWMENPACSPTVFRQATGRIDRIRQTKETRIYFPVYEGTLQVQLYDLLMRKVAVATATDGLDNESMLLAAGLNTEGYLSGLSIGRQLWAMLNSN